MSFEFIDGLGNNFVTFNAWSGKKLHCHTAAQRRQDFDEQVPPMQEPPGVGQVLAQQETLI